MATRIGLAKMMGIDFWSISYLGPR